LAYNIRYDLLNNKDWLYNEYIVKKLSMVEIAKRCNCANVTVGDRLKSFGIKIRSNNEVGNPNANWNLLNDKEWLYKKYVEEKLNTYQIAEFCNCHNSTVGEQLKKFSIKTRSSNETQNPKIKRELLNNKDWLYQKYIEEKFNTVQIAELCNCSYPTIKKQLQKFNIEIRPINEAFSPNVRWDLLNNKGWLYKKYWEEYLNTVQLAKICNCTDVTIGNKLKEFNIKIRETPIGKSGKDSPNWHGGISFEPYCYKFNEDLKENIRKKFNRKCFICGKSEEDNLVRLSVHHVDYNKGQGCGYSWSLIPLCSSCHSKTNYNRYYWFNLLNNYWLYKYFTNSNLF